MIELPPEIWHEVLHNITDHDLLPLRLVSKYFDHVITQAILNHARQSRLQIFRIRQYKSERETRLFFPYPSATPTYTSSNTRVLPDERIVEYTFPPMPGPEGIFYHPRENAEPENPWPPHYLDGSEWSFDFLQNAGNWNWMFHVFWSKTADTPCDFSIFFSESASNPRGEIIGCYDKKAVDQDDDLVDWFNYYEVEFRAVIKVPLKVLAHQFAGNLGIT
jgi:hypothetical protein